MDVRQARPEDEDAVRAFTSDIWADRGGDYIPHIYQEWIAGDGDDQRTLVADPDAEGELAGIAQVVRLSPWEAWCQGMRVNADYRGRGISRQLNDALFEWAREKGCSVARNMVFSFNVPGLGASRASGFEPATEFRWAHPDPSPGPEPDTSIDPETTTATDIDSDITVSNDPGAAYAYWTDSDARDHLRGLALDFDESWAVAELTRERLHRAADETAVITVGDPNTRGMTVRVRDYERENDDGDAERWVEYGAAAWDDVESARALFAAVARDAADVGTDRTRVLIPETARHVTDAAAARVELSDEPDFVFAAELTGGAWRENR